MELRKLGVEGRSFNGTRDKVNQTVKYRMFTPKQTSQVIQSQSI